MILDRFSPSSKLVVFYARRELSTHPSKSLEPEHIVLGIIRVEPTAITTYLASDWSLERVESALKLSPEQDAAVVPEHVEVPFSPPVEVVLRRAVVVADQLGRERVEPRHLLIALLEDESQSVTKMLHEAGLYRQRILESLRPTAAP
jgi:ATP-dependent Clp protease ATP-binding subunit ClpA